MPILKAESGSIGIFQSKNVSIGKATSCVIQELI
jgi:hypothetical protein